MSRSLTEDQTPTEEEEEMIKRGRAASSCRFSSLQAFILTFTTSQQYVLGGWDADGLVWGGIYLC